MIAGVYLYWGQLIPELIIIIGGGAMFLRLVVFNHQADIQVSFLEAIIQINRNEIKAGEGKYDNAEDGSEYINHQHEYSHDFDLFGPNSFFQFVNRTVSIFGRDTLAKWFNEPILEKENIEKKQEAIKELATKVDWRQEFLATGLIHRLDGKDRKRIHIWYNRKNKIGDGIVYEIMLYLLPILSFLLLGLAVLGFVQWTHFGLYLLVPIGFVGSYLKQINKQYYFLSNLVQKIEVLAKLTEKIEKEEFNSKLLKTWKNELGTEETSASVKIHELRSMLDKFEQRSNMLIGILLNAFLLWDLNLMRKMYRWKVANALEMDQWLTVVANFDATISLANSAFNDFSLVYPSISDKEFEVAGTNLYHPLLSKDERVGNDYEIHGKGHVQIITGANMAGKSTFLRTVGINMVLGMMGMPLSVESFKFSPMKVFSSMRTEDSLHSHSSFFHAELSRLARISDILKRGEKRFIILDEILKGTNSIDKARGSYAFVEKIIHYNMMGIIATHDLSLCELSEKHPNMITNKSFEVEFIGDDLNFDYKLRTGVCQNMNASFLLKKMGIVDSY
tara:strand:+ start:46094 stop:47776 length:1683 start_codon:yes stop_codon:yes gene_type:complete